MNQVIARTLAAAAGALLLAAAPIAPARAADPAVVADAALKPGDFVWQPGPPVNAAIEVVVSIPQQRAWVYRGGILIGVSTVSTGRPGHRTPVGSFDILEKRREHYSNKYNNAPMPFMQRLTWDGIALHAGEIPGRPASHGCIRLPLAFARKLFGVTQVGATVHVTELAPSGQDALAMVNGGETYTGMGGPEEPIGTD
jgi:lipoprotein-anchoring transpeptidase ErfK/SrfK